MSAQSRYPSLSATDLWSEDTDTTSTTSKKCTPSITQDDTTSTTPRKRVSRVAQDESS